MPKNTGKRQKHPTKSFRFNTLDWVCIIFGLSMSIITPFIDAGHPPVYVIVSIAMLVCGIFEMILGVRGRRSNYIFGLLNTITSFYITWSDHFYGNMLTNIFYLFICIIGFYSWGEHRDKKKDVIARRLTAKQAFITTVAFTLSSIGLNIALKHFGGHSTILDSTSTILIVLASFLGILRFREQWILWTVVNFLTLIMWLETGNPAVIGMRIFYVLGSIYGYINWRNYIKQNTPNED